MEILPGQGGKKTKEKQKVKLSMLKIIQQLKCKAYVDAVPHSSHWQVIVSYMHLCSLSGHFSLNGLTYSNNLKLEMPGFLGLGFFVIIFKNWTYFMSTK